MNREQIEKEVIKAICFYLDIEEEKITTGTSLQDLNIDSLDRVELIIELENEFGINLTPNYPNEFYVKNIKEISTIIEEKLLQKQDIKKDV